MQFFSVEDEAGRMVDVVEAADMRSAIAVVKHTLHRNPIADDVANSIIVVDI